MGPPLSAGAPTVDPASTDRATRRADRRADRHIVATRVARRIADHDGIITHTEAVELGMTRAAIHTRIDSGARRRLTPGVYLCGTHDLTGAARLRAAVAVHRAGADHTAAAFWHGMLDDLPAAITLSAPPTVTGRSSAPSPPTSSAGSLRPRTSRRCAGSG
ncbi:type IV toxin-antitoxin system AbiEi family antitoxin domain-containing protein [Gordonia sp. PP30]|uniref:type IV toxin-antitoxin system AbiEi family antitoxin domain-containing protein n=1 Tax=Gordonia sp. PP30 TaxID=2935861 RepID=UPI001FFE4954|nr:type IV toxin-antitoxin system AbiEi family antitoxin domain-containing protein [Gordonia sp. PP30]UQE73883.1 type IV toxin-antitoxin system AbiEi family antitoxin domain-containing protein [Gordonia sp. PP30]